MTAATRDPGVQIRPLHDGWKATVVAGPAPQHVAGRAIAACVPGTIHTDLMRAELIDDPHADRNEALQGWIGLSDVTYETTFVWRPDGLECTELVFDGLDTVATVRLNGDVIGNAENMHRSHTFDVTGRLVAGANSLAVEFRSPVTHADAESERLGRRPHVNPHPFNAIRKMACSFGWDWGPDLATVGIWRPVNLRSWTTARLAEVRPVALVKDGTGVVDVNATLDRTGNSPVTVVAEIAGTRTETTIDGASRSACLRVEVPHADLWWPRGMGSQALYPLLVSVEREDGTALDQTERRIGFRTVELDTAPDADGTPFVLSVNGHAVHIRGANWIPDDTLPHRITLEQLRGRIGQAQWAHMNLLRVWGGGVYESDDFFEECDAAGMLVWQDFLFACAAYAEEEPLRSEVEAEARENVARLAHHPSLVLWNGNNENLWAHEDWSWKPRLDGLTWGEHYYRELLPAIVADLSPHIPYAPGSPFSPHPGTHPNDPSHGTVHIWDVWNSRDWRAYAESQPRFVAEFGWQAPPTWATLTAALRVRVG